MRIALGPYCLAVELRARSALSDRRRKACVNIQSYRIELRQDLVGLRLAEAFLGCLIRVCHYRSGCQQGCVEEAYAHSLATGLVEFALRNPGAWSWFNRLVDRQLPRAGSRTGAPGVALARVPVMPEHLLVAGQPVRMRRISRTEGGRAMGWYHLQRREVQLVEGLSGVNLAVVAAHEITHALHHAYALKNRDSHANFIRHQTMGWLAFIRDNPGAWRWLAWSMREPPPARRRPGPGRRLPRTAGRPRPAQLR